MRFSQRYGYRSARKTLQKESMDEGLRVALWNAIYSNYIGNVQRASNLERISQHHYNITREVWIEFFNWPLDEYKPYIEDIEPYFRNFSIKYYQGKL